MIPIRHDLHEGAREDEPEETRNLTKKALHARLTEHYYLPDHTMRGVNRAYLVGASPMGTIWTTLTTSSMNRKTMPIGSSSIRSLRCRTLLTRLKFIYVADPVLNREEYAIDLCNRFAPEYAQ